MSIYVYGVDTTARTPIAGMLLRELSNAAIGKFEQIKHVKELAFKEGGYVLTFGAQALQEVTGQDGISERRGEMHTCPFNESLLVFSTWSPGFIYRNKENLPLFRDDLALFKTAIKLDRDGILA